MKAGTAQKMVLNMISTAAFVPLGQGVREHDGWTSWRTARSSSSAAGAGDDDHGRGLRRVRARDRRTARRSVKTAIVMLKRGCDRAEAEAPAPDERFRPRAIEILGRGGATPARERARSASPCSPRRSRVAPASHRLHAARCQRTAVEFWQPFGRRGTTSRDRAFRARESDAHRARARDRAGRDARLDRRGAGFRRAADLCVLDSTAMPALLEHAATRATGRRASRTCATRSRDGAVLGGRRCTACRGCFRGCICSRPGCASPGQADPSVAFELESIERFATAVGNGAGIAAALRCSLSGRRTAAQLSVFDSRGSGHGGRGRRTSARWSRGSKLLARLRPYCLAANQDSIEDPRFSPASCLVASPVRARCRGFLDARAEWREASSSAADRTVDEENLPRRRWMSSPSFNRSLHKGPPCLACASVEASRRLARIEAVRPLRLGALLGPAPPLSGVDAAALGTPDSKPAGP